MGVSLRIVIEMDQDGKVLFDSTAFDLEINDRQGDLLISGVLTEVNKKILKHKHWRFAGESPSETVLSSNPKTFTN